MLSIYIVSSWVLIQVLAVVWQPLGVPQISVTYLILVLLIGLPLYMFYIWRYQLRQLEIKKNLVGKNGKKKQSAFQRMYFSAAFLITLLVAVAVTFIINSAFKPGMDLPELVASDKIGILNFGNNTGKEELDIVSKMSADWIMHGITEQKLAQVVSPEIVNDYISIIKANEGEANNEKVLTDYFKPSKVIMGNYYLNNDKLIIQSSITDGDINKTLFSFQPVECDQDSPLDCIEDLKQKILGYLITEDKDKLNLQNFPPKFEAYQFYLEARANYSDPEKYLDLLNKSLEQDPNYFEPQLERISYYYNYGNFQKADSLFQLVKSNIKLSERQRNLISYYNALLEGDSRLIYNTFKKEYNIAPFDLGTNSTTMVFALQYVNKPLEIDTIYSKISMQRMDITQCILCEFRYYIKALADIEKELYQQVIDSFAPVTRLMSDNYFKNPLLAAYVRNGSIDELDTHLSEIQALEDLDAFKQSTLFASKELLMAGDKAKAASYLSQLSEIHKAKENKLGLAEVYYYMENYGKLVETIKVTDVVESPDIMSMLAVALHKTGRVQQALSLIQQLRSKDEPYTYGEIDYMLARFYAATDNRAMALDHLKKSIAKGYSFTPSTFQNDLHFISFKNAPEFQEILTYWH